jgi:hypothetical protein
VWLLLKRVVVSPLAKAYTYYDVGLNATLKVEGLGGADVRHIRVVRSRRTLALVVAQLDTRRNEDKTTTLLAAAAALSTLLLAALNSGSCWPFLAVHKYDCGNLLQCALIRKLPLLLPGLAPPSCCCFR